MRIVFMGTPDFAVESLKSLVEAGKNVVGVITAPDKPKGRGKKLGISAVKEYAVDKNLNILQPTNLKDPSFLSELESLKADLQVVVAFRMLPEVVWNMPPKGTINLHASLLPDYRGAAPINWAIMNGEKETGITTFFLKHEIDTGDIIFQEKEIIESSDTVGDLYTRLMNKGGKLVVKTVEAIENDTVQEIPQIEKPEMKKAPKIFKEDCQIDWNRNSEDLHNFIRGLSPYPAAWTKMHDKTLKVFQIRDTGSTNTTDETGQFSSDGKSKIKVSTANGSVELLDIQIEGKKRMKVEDFLRGYQWPS